MKKPYYQTPIVQEAHRCAAHYHGLTRELRRHSSFPYIVHPASVAQRVRKYFLESGIRFGDELKILSDILAVTHDVLENTEMPRDTYLQKFGLRSFRLLHTLTDEKYTELKTRTERTSAKLEALKTKLSQLAPKDAMIAAIVKYYDRVDNLKDFAKAGDYKFLEIYTPESKDLFDILLPYLPSDLQDDININGWNYQI